MPLVLPQASTASHILVIVLTHEFPPVTSAPTWFTVAVLQASVAVGGVKVGRVDICRVQITCVDVRGEQIACVKVGRKNIAAKQVGRVDVR